MPLADFDWRDWATRDTTLTAVVGITLVAVLARVVGLGGRIAHFDEGRVAYWALEYAETGSIHYRYIVHGPLVQYVDAFLFQVLGPSDFAMRLPLALFGGVLPLAALSFRERLRDSEVVALAAVLAFNPVLLYYSRFLRSTLLVAGFVFVAFGLAVRAYDTRRVGYVYGVALFLALALTAKENAVVYGIVWVGATALLVDHLLFGPWSDERGVDVARGYWSWLSDSARSLGRRGVAACAGHVVGAVLLFLLVVFYFFAPRNPSSGVGLWYAVGHPGSLLSVIDATIADLSAGFGYWFGGASDPGCHKDNLVDGYICFLGRFAETLLHAAAPLSLFAVGGFLLERYGTVRPRALVMFASYWGFVSVVGYPLGTDIYGPWITINALVPLAIPAAVGFAFVYRQGRAAFVDEDPAALGVAALVLLLVVGQVGVTAGALVYDSPTGEDNALVQYAQPNDDYRNVLERVDRADTDDGTDLVIYGDQLMGEHRSPQRPHCGDLANLLPMQWYIARHDLDATCVSNQNGIEDLRAERPPLIVARGTDASTLQQHLDGYQLQNYDFRTIGERTSFFVREDIAGPSVDGKIDRRAPNSRDRTSG